MGTVKQIPSFITIRKLLRDPKMAKAGIFEEEELKSFREEFGHFSEEDLLLAIKQARLEIFEDLKNYQVIDVITEKTVRSRPAASVSLPSSQVWREEEEVDEEGEEE